MDGAGVEALALVDLPVQDRRLLRCLALDDVQAALGLHPPQHLADHRDREHRGGVEQRLLVEVNVVAQVAGDGLIGRRRGRGADEDHGHAGRAEILLHAAIDEIEPFPWNGPRHQLRGHVGDEGHVHHRELGETDPADGLVGSDVEVARSVPHLDLGVVRGACIPFCGAVPGGVDLAVVPGVGDGALRPRPGVHVARGLAATKQIHRHHGELEDRSPLDEQHVEVLRRPEHLERQTPRLLVDRVVLRRTVAHLDERKARSLVVQ